MHKMALVTKPVEPTGTFNGFLSAVVNGLCGFSDYPGEYSFLSPQDLANPDDALRGHENVAYAGVPRLENLDPTSPLAVSLTAAHRRQPKGKVGYTHHFMGLDYMSAVSAQFAHWLREFNAIYEAASKAQAAQESDTFSVLDTETQIHYGSGDVEAFYAAVGNINTGHISYPNSQELDVNKVYDKVMSSLSAHIDILDELGYREGESNAAQHIGISAFPKTGASTLCITASSMDRLYRSPWARILSCPRTRDLYEDRFMDRVNEAMKAKTGAMAAPAADWIGIAEGDDVFYVPATLCDAGWAAICAAADARPTIMQRLDTTTALWTDQLYTKGDLVALMLDGSLDPRFRRLRVAVTTPVVYQNPAGVDMLRFGPDVAGTGALSSLDPWTPTADNVNIIGGSIPIRVDGGEQCWEGSGADSLPSGVLYLGNCGEATAVNWMDILRSLSLYLPQELKDLLSKTGRAKRSLPKGSTTLSSFDALLGEVISNGQRDGYLNVPSLAFNATRLTRDEQDGPIMAGVNMSPDGNSSSVSSYGVSNVNGWDRLDNSEGRYLVSPMGQQIELDRATTSRFTGEWDAGRYAVWSPASVSEAISLGTGSVVSNIGQNLMCLPGALDANGVFQPRYAPQEIVDGTFAQAIGLDSVDDAPNLRGAIAFGDVANGAVPGYELGLNWESWHPTRGFVRGLANYFAHDHWDSVGLHPAEMELSMENTRKLGTTTLATIPAGQPRSWYNVLDQQFYNLMHSGEVSGVPFTGTGRTVSTWLWDPTRADIVGDSWFRWAGHRMDGALPHPYMPHPVAVCTAAVDMTALQVGASMAVRPATVALIGGGEPTNGFLVQANSDLEVPVIWPHTSMTVAGNDWASDSETMHRTHVIGRSTSWEGMVGDAVAGAYAQQLASSGANIPIDYNLTGAVAGEEYGLVPKYDAIIPMTNGCDRKGFANDHVTTAGPHRGIGRPPYSTIAPATDGPVGDFLVTKTDATGTIGGCASNLMTKFEGELTIPAGAFNGGLGRTVDAANSVTIAIDGRGFLFEGDILTGNVLSHKSWLESVASDDNSLLHNSFTNFWPVGALSATAHPDEFFSFNQVEAPQTLSNFDPDLTAAQRNLLKARAVHEQEGVANDWFRKGVVLQPKQARMRKKALVNPWIRPLDGAGMNHLRYETDELSALFDAQVKAVIAQGKKFQTGLENSLFLEIQRAN